MSKFESPKSTHKLKEDQFYLSIVATTRNDNHGGDLLKRTAAFVNSVYVQSAKFNLPVELILVEWNPPADKPLLKEVLPKPRTESQVELRYVVVPAETHNTYRFASSMPLYQMIAKNVGIRRAKGEFILCTNIDILFSDDSFKILAKRSLEYGKFYRSNRCDIPKEVLEIEGHSDQLVYGEKSVIKRLGRSQGQEALNAPAILYKFPRLVTLLNTFMVGLWRKFHPGKFAHFLIDFMACGDFTLMSKKDWLNIDGYVELDMYSIHVDSMGLWSACAMGMEQVIFPFSACIYHIDHEDGWESDDVIKTIKFLSDKPSLDYSIVYKAGIKMVETKTNWGLNEASWGWADEKFDEYVFDGKTTQ
jgi:hypothetical protein